MSLFLLILLLINPTIKKTEIQEVKPVLAILGGAKVSSKITIINNIIDKIDKLIAIVSLSFLFTLGFGLLLKARDKANALSKRKSHFRYGLDELRKMLSHPQTHHQQLKLFEQWVKTDSINLFFDENRQAFPIFYPNGRSLRSTLIRHAISCVISFFYGESKN